MEPLSDNARNVKPCPFCRELIDRAAVRCRHCHGDLKTPIRKKKQPFGSSPFMIGFYTASIIWIILIIIYIWKF
ncbi:MAG: hypothetical protein GY841_21750 [FCB group bacterium]|nr:hypothetical protein [FCB group bacterium]